MDWIHLPIFPALAKFSVLLVFSNICLQFSKLMFSFFFSTLLVWLPWEPEPDRCDPSWGHLRKPCELKLDVAVSVLRDDHACDIDVCAVTKDPQTSNQQVCWIVVAILASALVMHHAQWCCLLHWLPTLTNWVSSLFIKTPHIRRRTFIIQQMFSSKSLKMV